MSETNARTESGFLRFSLEPRVQRGLDAIGFAEPRPIQAETIPAGLEGRDVLGLAHTGTGKTAAFVVPILQRLLAKPRPGPRALIVAPTRELAMQIHAELKTLAQFTGVKAITIFGGVSQGPQERGLRSRPDIIVACPGRLLDLMQQGLVKLNGVEVLVLDEADHMFDMGFLPDIKRILSALPQQRQNLLFSATMPREVRGLADQTLRKPHTVQLNHGQPAETIEHALYPVQQSQKFNLLRHLMEDKEFKSAIVFLRTKHRAKRLAEQLDKAGHSAVALQGNMTQGQRDRAMTGFRNGRFDVLVATDIAARGIDVANISHVINFDLPNTPDAYTHRIGRTGRAECNGKAYTFVSAEDYPAVHAIERRLGSKIERREAPGFVTSKPPADAPLTLAAERRPRPGGFKPAFSEGPSRGRPRRTGGPRRRRNSTHGR